MSRLMEEIQSPHRSLCLCCSWVGYEKEGFRGHQYLLEEGKYQDWRQWGGYDKELVSLRLIRTVRVEPVWAGRASVPSPIHRKGDCQAAGHDLRPP